MPGPRPTLANADFFRGLEPDQFKAIAKEAMHRHYPARTTVIEQEGAPNSFLMLAEGRMRFYYLTPDGNKRILMPIVSGQVFGLGALLSKPYLVSVESVRDSMALEWSGQSIRMVLQSHPKLWQNLLSITRDYLGMCIVLHGALCSTSARERLGQFIMAYGAKKLWMTNQELGDAANLNVYTVSRIMNEWRREGLIRRDGKAYLLLASPEKLLGRKPASPGEHACRACGLCLCDFGPAPRQNVVHSQN